ncbi:hypothetical protein SAMN06265370_1044 [Puniceibacterium sediminis]|uniref:Transposase n=2 Tax=Puniceibacterium sediminis TaxID=1608407 RepID=A0A238VZK6_9RHOB|nr:hypothetical protein SAMN06265370_1044 [Puniceibacterium sediminis]
MSGIAEACGFDRQILYKNPQAKKLLNEAIKHKGLKGIEARDGNTDAERIALERQITALQQTNSSLIAEVYDLRQKLKRFKHIEEMIELGIRVII